MWYKLCKNEEDICHKCQKPSGKWQYKKNIRGLYNMWYKKAIDESDFLGMDKNNLPDEYKIPAQDSAPFRGLDDNATIIMPPSSDMSHLKHCISVILYDFSLVQNEMAANEQAKSFIKQTLTKLESPTVTEQYVLNIAEKISNELYDHMSEVRQRLHQRQANPSTQIEGQTFMRIEDKVNRFFVDYMPFQDYYQHVLEKKMTDPQQ